MRKKLISLLLVGIVCTTGLVACGKEESKSNVSETISKTEEKPERYNDFKDYENEKYGFSIKYPNQLTKVIKEDDNGIEVSGIMTELENKKTQAEKESEKNGVKSDEKERKSVPLTLKAWGEDNKSGANLKTYYENEKATKNYSPNTVIFSLKEKDYYVMCWKDKEKEMIYYEKGFVKDDKIVKFRYSYAEDKKENYNEILDKTYDSFKLK